jgi:N-methylhydantoinase A/oxoprolinase/acetone carboxylase beta subunit
VKDGIVQVCGLTPTDIMHIKGDFSRFSAEASTLSAQFVAQNIGKSVEWLCDFVYDEVKRKLYTNIAEALLENQGMSRGGFVRDSYGQANGEFVSVNISTNLKLTGVGAPIHIFLHDIAKKLNTTAILPKHHEVANAVGAIAGNVCAEAVIEIAPNNSAAGITGYTVFGRTRSPVFESLTEAEAFAVTEAEEAARSEVIKRGAANEIEVSCTLTHREAPAKNGTVYLGTQAVAYATGHTPAQPATRSVGPPGQFREAEREGQISRPPVTLT